MKRLIAAILVALTGATGCSSGHYYSIRGDALYLYLQKPEAHSVYFAYSLDDFNLHPARESATGTWEVRLPANKEFRYFYIADGELFIPSCRFTEPDDFGTRNCIFIPKM